jgi:hypothetical protein
MSVSVKKITKLHKDAGTAVGNLIDNTPVLEKIQEYGFINEDLVEKQTLLQDMEKLMRETETKAGKKAAFYMRLAEKIEEFHKICMLHIFYLRRDLNNKPDLIKEFQLNGKREQTTLGKLRGAKKFFKNCQDITGLGEQVQSYGLTSEKLTEILDEIALLEQEAKQWAVLKKDAEKATDERNKVFKELNTFWLKLKATLTHVFRDDQQQLEAFNITGYSEGYKRKTKKTNSTDSDNQNTETESQEEETQEQN